MNTTNASIPSAPLDSAIDKVVDNSSFNVTNSVSLKKMKCLSTSFSSISKFIVLKTIIDTLFCPPDNAKYEVSVSMPAFRKMRSLFTSILLCVVYDRAMKYLYTKSSDELQNDGKVKEVSENTYLYRVNSKERILFGEKGNERIIVGAGETTEILKNIKKRVASEKKVSITNDQDPA